MASFKCGSCEFDECKNQMDLAEHSRCHLDKIVSDSKEKKMSCKICDVQLPGDHKLLFDHIRKEHPKICFWCMTPIDIPVSVYHTDCFYVIGHLTAELENERDQMLTKNCSKDSESLVEEKVSSLSESLEQ